MLWVDDHFVTSTELIKLDPELVEIAATETIDLEFFVQKGREAAQAALGPFLDISNLSPQDLTYRNINRTSFTSSYNLQKAGWAQIVVHGDNDLEWSLLKRWVVDLTQKELYAACANKFGDRYQDKHDAAEERRYKNWGLFRRTGLPLVMNPLIAPGARYQRVGTFDNNSLSVVAGAGTAEYDVQVRITWVASDGTESYPSPIAYATLVDTFLLRVSIVGLTVPTTSQPTYTTALSQYTPKAAVGWNVYVGSTEEGSYLYKQNASLIPTGTTTYTLTGDPVLSGTVPGLGQDVEILLNLASRIRRG